MAAKRSLRLGCRSGPWPRSEAGRPKGGLQRSGSLNKLN